MSVEDIDRRLADNRSSIYMPIIWRTVGRFAIEPPEQFYQMQVLGLIQADIGKDSPIAPSTIHREIHALDALGMVRRVDPSFRGMDPKWYIRTDPESWDYVFSVMPSEGAA